MKPKISPEDYSKILDSINLENIALVDSSFKVKDCEENGGNINLKFNDSYSFLDKQDYICFYSSFKLIGSFEGNPESQELFVMKAKYEIRYSKKDKKVDISTDFFQVFKEISLPMFTWPYFREFIQNTLVRACIPPVTLPVRKFGPSK